MAVGQAAPRSMASAAVRVGQVPLAARKAAASPRTRGTPSASIEEIDQMAEE